MGIGNDFLLFGSKLGFSRMLD